MRHDERDGWEDNERTLFSPSVEELGDGMSVGTAVKSTGSSPRRSQRIDVGAMSSRLEGCCSNTEKGGWLP